MDVCAFHYDSNTKTVNVALWTAAIRNWPFAPRGSIYNKRLVCFQ